MNKEGHLINAEPFTLMNFSAGSRSCIGKQLALTEIKTIVVEVLKNYEILIDDSQKEYVFEEFAYNLKNVDFRIKRI